MLRILRIGLGDVWQRCVPSGSGIIRVQHFESDAADGKGQTQTEEYIFDEIAAVGVGTDASVRPVVSTEAQVCSALSMNGRFTMRSDMTSIRITSSANGGRRAIE